MFENTFKNVDDILHKDVGCFSGLVFVDFQRSLHERLDGERSTA